MKKILVALPLLLLILAPLASQDWDDQVVQLVNQRRLSDLESWLQKGYSPNGFSDSGRDKFETALLAAPSEYLGVFLKHGFNPNLITARGGYSERYYSSFTQGSFIYRAMCSGRTELLSLLAPTDAALCARNARLAWVNGKLQSLKVETLADAAKRMADGDSLAFLAEYSSRISAGHPDAIEGTLGSLTLATVNDDGVRLRDGPGTSFAVAGRLARGQSLNVVAASPPRFLDDQPWQDRWFQLESGGKIVGWAWGGYLDLPWGHGQKLTGPLLVDHALLRQGLYKDIWDRATDPDVSSFDKSWGRHLSLWEWALPLKDKAFAHFLMEKHAPTNVLPEGEEEEGESLFERFLHEGDEESIRFWLSCGYHVRDEARAGFSLFPFPLLVEGPEAARFKLFEDAGFDFNMQVDSSSPSYGDATYTNFAIASGLSVVLPNAPVSLLLALVPQIKSPNAIFISWTHNLNKGYETPQVRTLLDMAGERGDPRLVKGIKDIGGLSRDAVMAAAPIDDSGIISFPGPMLRRGKQHAVMAVPKAIVNSDEADLRETVDSKSILRKLVKGERVFLLDDSSRFAPPGIKNEDGWYYVMTEKREFGWTVAAYLMEKDAMKDLRDGAFHQ
jgi:hypothetical protein